MQTDQAGFPGGRARTLSTLVSCALLFGACGGSEAPPEELLRPVRVVTITDDAGARSRSFTGTLRSTQESRLSFKVGGTVTGVPVQVGQVLKRGSLIAELDGANYALQVEQAQATLVEAQAGERNALSTYERTKGLYANDNASLNELDASRAAAEAAAAQVRAAAKALEIARLNESYTRLYASSDCSVAAVDIEINENVSAGQQVAMVSCGTDYEVELDLPESVISSVDQSTPVSIAFNAIPGMEFSGEVSEVSTAGRGAVFPVTVRANETHPLFRSGLAADVTFQFETSGNGDTFVLPLAAVINDPDGVFVFLAEQQGSSNEALVVRRDIEIGEVTQDGIEIVAGLSPGDHVITAGVSVIRSGQRVLLP